MDYSFGNWIKRRRKGLDLTQQELAQLVGCSSSLIFKIESDERRPSRQITELLAQHLEIPPDERALFRQVARHVKTLDSLESLSSLSTPKSALVSQPLRQINQPLPLSPIIGREHELRAIKQQIQAPSCRLLTLTGPGGVGKTRLASEVAFQLRGAFNHGVYFVSLVGTSASEFIIPVISSSLDFSFSGMIDLKQQLFHFLLDKQILLVLDNLEHLLEGIELLEELLEYAPSVKLLTTSREPLNLRPEWVFEVQGMPVPTKIESETFGSNSAVALFILRAKQANVIFQPSKDDFPSIKRICQLVEGLPLGIELAAAWVRTMSVNEIADEIEEGLDFLTSTARGIPQRHRSMRAVFDQSWSLLSEEERIVLERLSVFRGGFSRNAAEKVTGATLSVLSSLVDKSLIRYIESKRYNMHELMRQYAHEKLTFSGQLEEAGNRHLEFFLSAAEESRSKLRGPEQVVKLQALGQDYDNLRAALEWSLRYEGSSGEVTPSEKQNIQASLRLTRALYQFWRLRVHWSEGRKWLQRALAQSVRLPPSLDRVETLGAAVLLAVDQGDTQPARQLANENLELAQQLGDPFRIAHALNSLGLVLWKQKDYAAARLNCEQALARFRELGGSLDIADTLRALGHIATNHNDLESAQAYLEECLAIFQDLGNQIEANAALSDLGLLAYLRQDLSTAHSYLQKSLVFFREIVDIEGTELALNRLGDIARCESDYDEAERCYKECLTIYRETGDKDEIPSLLHNLGYVEKHRGDYPQAMKLFREALLMHIETGNQAGIAECLAGAASVFTAQGQAERGARLYGVSEVLHEKVDAVLWPANRIEFEHSLAVLRELLDEATLTVAWAEGRAMSIDQALVQLSVQA